MSEDMNEESAEELENEDQNEEETSVVADDVDDSISTININDEMKSSYIEYAMSVIVGRALPDVRDGLKPVHRRILYAMYDQGYTAGRAYKKSARIVGDVLGRYHPHGDSAVYDSLVRMAQDFSLRYPLIDGQGNFGSVDGDNAAAMRYTESRMARISMSLLEDIEKDTVTFAPNFDESLEEPTVLPTRLPTLLLNGTAGIAVGMATNIPPHNITEVMAGINTLIDDPDATAEDLMEHIQGPDFPTGGIICGRKGIHSAYTTGRGSVVVRSKVHFEELKGNKKAIIVTEIPYQVNKANLIIKIAELVGDKKITGISDLRDESDRKGMRIYIELKRDANDHIVLNQLYKHTQLQNSFGVNMVALVNGIPKTLTLKEMLVHYLNHRIEVITKRTEYDLKKAKDRLHILEGLRIALQNIDRIITIIKSSKDAEEAKESLKSEFGLSDKQTAAILDMRLQRLTGLEQDKIEQEYKEIQEKIKDLEDILSSKERVNQIIKDEHQFLVEKYGDERRSEIGEAVDSVDLEDLIPNLQVAVLYSTKGFVKRMPISLFRSQLRGGRGVNSMTTRDEDFIDQMFVTNNHDYMMSFTNKGRVFKFKAYQIPEASRQSKGVSISHFLNLEEDERVTTMIPVKRFDTEEFLFMTTAKGTVKKTPLNAFIHFKNRPIIAINLDEGDQLNWVHKTDGQRDILLVTTDGMVIRFNEEQVRSMGRASRGVRGIRIKPEDSLSGIAILDPTDEESLLLIITAKGYGKNIRVNEFRCQNRGGIGVKSLKFRKTVKGDYVTDAAISTKEDELVIVTKGGTLCRQKVASISTQRRESQGVIIVKLDAKDEVQSMSVVKEDEEGEEEAAAANPPAPTDDKKEEPKKEEAKEEEKTTKVEPKIIEKSENETEDPVQQTLL